MAIKPSDFSKIWASNADTPEYTFTEANYLKGWDFVGNLPPTRAQWNAIQKSTDEKMKYVFDNFGAPLTASTVAGMTMQNRVYVYTGSETGYTAGHWYYWNGSAWADGGVYNSIAFSTDKTLTISGAAADAGAVGAFLEDSYNLLDKFSVSLIDANFSATSTTISGSAKTKTLYIPCKPNTTYTVVRRTGYYRWITGTTVTTPVVGGAITYVPSTSETVTGTMAYRTYTTPANANYLAVYFYHSDHDSGTVAQMLDDMMIYEGTEILPYTPHKLAIPNTEKLTEFLSLQVGLATSVIPNSTDIDSVVTPGTYIIPLSTNAETMTNLPIAIGGRLVVMETTTSGNRLAQLYITNTSVPRMFYRNYPSDSWLSWVELTSSANSLFATNIMLTSDNYTDYFTSYNDAPVNSIVSISTNVPLTDGPVGDERLVTDSSASGYIRGVLLTFTQRMGLATSTTAGSNVAQVLLGYRRMGDYKPTLSYRVQVSGVWSDWSKFEENGYLHASNIIVYGGSLDVSFSDMNNMPKNTIYQLDLNLDGSDEAHTLKNHPAPGVSCVAMCYAYSYTSSHGKVQTVFTIDGRMYWRYGYYNAPNDYRWTPWKQVLHDDGSVMQNKGRLPNGTDLNAITDNSIYLLGAMPGAGYSNDPITSAGFLTVKATNSIVLQVVEALAGTRFSRYSENDGTTWSLWS